MDISSGAVHQHALLWWWYQSPSLPLGMHPQQQQCARVGRSFCLASLWSFNPAIVVLLCKHSLLPSELPESVCPWPPSAKQQKR